MQFVDAGEDGELGTDDDVITGDLDGVVDGVIETSWYVDPFYADKSMVLMAAAVLHAVHLALSRRARRQMAAFVPCRDDWYELKGRIAFLVGRREAPPPVPAVGYPEKAEYLAVIWGTAIMAITGFMLWFDDAMLRWAPKWLLDVATVIHLYEAILASLAILVWHFYFVLLDPVVYPMDPAWLTGRSAARRFAERLEGARERRRR